MPNKTQSDCGPGKIVDPTNPLGCIDRPTCPNGGTWALTEPHCPVTTPTPGPSAYVPDTAKFSNIASLGGLSNTNALSNKLELTQLESK